MLLAYILYSLKLLTLLYIQFSIKTTDQCYWYICLDTPGNLSIPEWSIGPNSIVLTWSRPLCNYSISCCPAPHFENECSDECQRFSLDDNSESSFANITGLKPYTLYKCCVWEVYEDGNGTPSCKFAQTTEAGIKCMHVYNKVTTMSYNPPQLITK